MSAPEKSPKSGEPVNRQPRQDEEGAAERPTAAGTAGPVRAKAGDQSEETPRRGVVKRGAAAERAEDSDVASRRAKRRKLAERRAAKQLEHAQEPVRPVARHARFQTRHLSIALSFLLFVVAPVAVSAWYLYARAADQYASFLGFSVRSEGGTSQALDLLGGITGLSENSTSDPDILYKFLTSAELVENVDARLDLKTIWSRAQEDPLVCRDAGQGRA